MLLVVLVFSCICRCLVFWLVLLWVLRLFLSNISLLVCIERLFVVLLMSWCVMWLLLLVCLCMLSRLLLLVMLSCVFCCMMRLVW